MRLIPVPVDLVRDLMPVQEPGRVARQAAAERSAGETRADLLVDDRPAALRGSVDLGVEHVLAEMDSGRDFRPADRMLPVPAAQQDTGGEHRPEPDDRKLRLAPEPERRRIGEQGAGEQGVLEVLPPGSRELQGDFGLLADRAPGQDRRHEPDDHLVVPVHQVICGSDAEHLPGEAARVPEFLGVEPDLPPGVFRQELSAGQPVVTGITRRVKRICHLSSLR